MSCTLADFSEAEPSGRSAPILSENLCFQGRRKMRDVADVLTHKHVGVRRINVESVFGKTPVGGRRAWDKSYPDSDALWVYMYIDRSVLWTKVALWLTAGALRFRRDALPLRAAGGVQFAFVRVGHSVGAADRSEDFGAVLGTLAPSDSCDGIDDAGGAKSAVLALARRCK
jgi:hypothetical protein